VDDGERAGWARNIQLAFLLWIPTLPETRCASGWGSLRCQLHPKKTRLIEFGRFAAERCQRRGLGKPQTFNFLGCELAPKRDPC
jgi:hypothetical protein